MATPQAIDPITGLATMTPNPGQVYRSSNGGVDQSLPVAAGGGSVGAQAVPPRGQVYKPTMGSVDHSTPMRGG